MCGIVLYIGEKPSGENEALKDLRVRGEITKSFVDYLKTFLETYLPEEKISEFKLWGYARDSLRSFFDKCEKEGGLTDKVIEKIYSRLSGEYPLLGEEIEEIDIPKSGRFLFNKGHALVQRIVDQTGTFPKELGGYACDLMTHGLIIEDPENRDKYKSVKKIEVV